MFFELSSWLNSKFRRPNLDFWPSILKQIFDFRQKISMLDQKCQVINMLLTGIFLYTNLFILIFFTRKFMFFYTKIFAFFTPKFLLFYTKIFAFFYTKIFAFFTPKFLLFLHQNNYFFYTKIFAFLHQILKLRNRFFC